MDRSGRMGQFQIGFQTFWSASLCLVLLSIIADVIMNISKSLFCYIIIDNMDNIDVHEVGVLNDEHTADIGSDTPNW